MEWTLCLEHRSGVRWILVGLKKVNLELGIGNSVSFVLMEIRKQRAPKGRQGNNTVGWPAKIQETAWPQHRGHLLSSHLHPATLRTWLRRLHLFWWARARPCRRWDRMKPASFLFLVLSIHAPTSRHLLRPLPASVFPQIVTWFPPSPLSSFHLNFTFSRRPSLTTLFKIGVPK